MQPTELEGLLLSIPKPKDLDGLRVVLHFTMPGAGEARPQNPSVLFEVTLKADNISSSGRLIKFEHGKGDEYHGCVRRDWLVIEEVLGKVAEDGKTVTVIERERMAA